MPMHAGRAHVWGAGLGVSPARLADLAATLSAEERERAARFRDPRDADRWRAGRGILRELLAAYLGVPAREIQLAYGPNGRPVLAGRGEPPLYFNLSHSDGRALFCFARDFAPGIDVEAIREFDSMSSVAEHFFSPAERSSLAAIPPARRTRAFYCCWTRKEAYLKACGRGLSVPLDSFDVSISEDEPAALLRIAEAPGEAASEWSLLHLEPADGFVGAVAARTRQLQVECHTWSA